MLGGVSWNHLGLVFTSTCLASCRHNLSGSVSQPPSLGSPLVLANSARAEGRVTSCVSHYNILLIRSLNCTRSPFQITGIRGHPFQDLSYLLRNLACLGFSLNFFAASQVCNRKVYKNSTYNLIRLFPSLEALSRL